MGIVDQFKDKAQELLEQARSALSNKVPESEQAAEKAKDTGQDAMEQGQEPMKQAPEETEGPW